VSTAWHLAQKGRSVLLCEKGRVAGEQSSRNWGWIRQQGRDPDELPIMMEASRLWDDMDRQTGEDCGFQREGVVYLASDEKKLAELEAWLEVARQHQLDTRMLSAAEIESMMDCTPGQWIGGLYTQSDGRAEPWKAVPAMAVAAQRAGAKIRESCAVRTIEQTAGEVTAVVTESGTVRCERVVLAAGAWSSLFLGNLGLQLPQLAVRSTVAATAPVTDVFKGNAADEKIAFRRRQDGGYSLALCDFREHYVGRSSFQYFKPFIPAIMDDWRSTRLRPAAPAQYPDAWGTARRWQADETTPFEQTRVLNPMPNRGCIERMKSRIAERFPALANVPIQEAWAGMIETTPDIVPVIDALDDPRGLVLATGFSGHGFGIGPAAGKLVAELVMGQPVAYDLQRFRFSRFSDGSKMELGPAL
jgi:glycine/D-amino acid oxidase-like deaminating enzyme